MRFTFNSAFSATVFICLILYVHLIYGLAAAVERYLITNKQTYKNKLHGNDRFSHVNQIKTNLKKKPNNNKQPIDKNVLIVCDFMYVEQFIEKQKSLVLRSIENFVYI